jgi:hypothetical protein
MKLRVALALVSVLLSSAVARADFNLSFQVKWEPYRYVLPQLATQVPPGAGMPPTTDPGAPGASGTSPLPSNSSVNAFQRQDLNARLGLGFTDKFTLQIGLDIARASLSETVDTNSVNRGFTTIGFAVGLKYNFIAPAREKISPYIYGDFFKYFTALNDDRPNNLPQNEVEFSAGLAAPFGFHIAFGVEYYFTESFGIGAELFGFEGAFSSGSMRRTENGNSVSHDQSLNTFSYYTALTLIFRAPRVIRYGGGSRYRYDRDRDEREKD